GRALFFEALADVNLYLLGSGFFALRHVNHEHTVLELSFYFVSLGQIGKSETSDETAVGTFDSMVFLLRLFLLELAFAGDREDSVLDCHFYVFLFHVRQLGFNHVFLVIFGNVGERFPISQGDIISFSSVRAASKETRKPVFYVCQFHWFPAGECIDHWCFPFLRGGGLSAASRPPPAENAARLHLYLRADTTALLGNLSNLFQIMSRRLRGAERGSGCGHRSVGKGFR